jgi:hypothetical protein
MKDKRRRQSSRNARLPKKNQILCRSDKQRVSLSAPAANTEIQITLSSRTAAMARAEVGAGGTEVVKRNHQRRVLRAR